MPKTSLLDVFMQQLDVLSLVDLIKVKARVDALILGKSSPLSNIWSTGSYVTRTPFSSEITDIDVTALFSPVIPGSSLKGQLKSAIISANLEHINLKEFEVVQFYESEAKVDDSLDKVIGLVDEWMADESEYDEETYPQVEIGLNQNQMSV